MAEKRKGLKQIEINPGDIILNFSSTPVNKRDLMEIISRRMTRKDDSLKTGDIMVVFLNEYKILRFK